MGHDRPPWYFITTIWSDLAPWVLMLPFALAWIVRRRLWRDRWLQLALIWFGTFFVFLSIAATKRQAYLLPAYPAIAIVLAVWLDSLRRNRGSEAATDERPARVLAVVFHGGLLALGVIALGAAAGLGPIVAQLDLDPATRAAAASLRPALLMLAAVAIGSWFWVRPARRAGDLDASLLRLALVQIVIFGFFAGVVQSALNPINTYVPQLTWLREQLPESGPLGYLGRSGKVGAFGYYTGRHVQSVRSPDELEAFFTEYPDSLVIVYDGYAGKFLDAKGADWRSQVVDEFVAARRLYYVLRARGWEQSGA
jgi:hypothetical protein